MAQLVTGRLVPVGVEPKQRELCGRARGQGLLDPSSHQVQARGRIAGTEKRLANAFLVEHARRRTARATRLPDVSASQAPAAGGVERRGVVLGGLGHPLEGVEEVDVAVVHARAPEESGSSPGRSRRATRRTRPRRPGRRDARSTAPRRSAHSSRASLVIVWRSHPLEDARHRLVLRTRFGLARRLERAGGARASPAEPRADGPARPPGASRAPPRRPWRSHGTNRSALVDGSRRCRIRAAMRYRGGPAWPSAATTRPATAAGLNRWSISSPGPASCSRSRSSRSASSRSICRVASSRSPGG